MIVLDTHIWIWWVHDPSKLTDNQIGTISQNESDLICVSTISCWEIAKLVERNRLDLPVSIEKWFNQALGYPGMQLISISPAIAIESTRLGDKFHRDPADQLIVATARILDCPLVTSDEKIVRFPSVETIY